MKVWWCNVHDAEQSVPGVMCWKKEVRMIGALRRHCRFVEMQLVPADARMVSGESEHCDECGQAYDEVYALPDALWARIHERAPAGLLCPGCALNRVVSVSDPTKAEPPKDPWDYDP